MKNHDLFRAIGEADDKFILDCENDRGRRLVRFLPAVCAAAAAVLIFAAGISLYNRPSTIPATDVKPTSEQYSSLDELLLYLSSNETHDDKALDGPESAVNSAQESRTAVTDGKYSYHLTEHSLKISKLSGGKPQSAGEIPGEWQSVFLHEKNLALVKTYYDGEDSISANPMVKICIYNLDSPENPVKIHETEILGTLSSSFCREGTLYILTSDGECACGWSRLDDKSKYIPSVVCDGEKTAVSDENIKILGSPSAVKYLAVTKISMVSGEYLNTKAYYGDVSGCFYSGEFLTVEVRTQKMSELYIFENDEFKGKLTADFDIASVVKSGGILRITGASENELVVMTADTGGGVIERKSFAGHDRAVDINEVINEEDRQIISWSFFDVNNAVTKNYFAFVNFNGGSINVTESEVRVDYVNGIDMIYSCRPFGEIDSMIKLGGGLYARYNQIPNGIDLFDFSENKTVCVYDSPDMLGSGRFMLKTFPLGGGKFAAVAVTPGRNEEGDIDYRDQYLTSCIYVCETDGTSVEFIRKAEIPTYRNAELFEADGIWYCTTEKSGVPVVFEEC